MPPTRTAHATASDAQSVAAVAYKAFDAMSEYEPATRAVEMP